VEQFLIRDRLAATRVLIVDDDRAVLETMRVSLEPHDLESSSYSTPARMTTSPSRSSAPSS
jgi:FixJ family two-component response regulator